MCKVSVRAEISQEVIKKNASKQKNTVKAHKPQWKQEITKHNGVFLEDSNVTETKPQMTVEKM